MKRIIVSGAFDDVRFRDFRFLYEAGKLGPIDLLLWSDQAVQTATGTAPKFPQVEREYFIGALRYVKNITLLDGANNPDALPNIAGAKPDVWIVPQWDDTPAKRQWAQAAKIEYHVVPESALREAPPAPSVPNNPPASGKKVVVTGCYDWFHSGHVRFFEECSELGDLYVVVGHDENIRLLKGEGHPLFPATQRRFIVGSIRFVKQALISSGNGWMDAEPEFVQIKPHIYAVNEDGDKPEKRAFCEKHGIEYKVLKRLPKQGLPRRQSTDLRGF
jgi:cytidyltransferase-like protein